MTVRESRPCVPVHLSRLLYGRAVELPTDGQHQRPRRASHRLTARWRFRRRPQNRRGYSRTGKVRQPFCFDLTRSWKQDQGRLPSSRSSSVRRPPRISRELADRSAFIPLKNTNGRTGGLKPATNEFTGGASVATFPPAGCGWSVPIGLKRPCEMARRASSLEGTA
jgi:hypothetical protein